MTTLSLPDGLTWRAATMADVDSVVALQRAEELATGGEAHTTAGDVRSDWNRPSMDLASDAVLVHDDDRLVGQAEQLDGRAYVAVHPEACGRGIGSALLTWTEGQARRQGHPRIGQTVPDAAAATAELLRVNGYRPRWQSWMFSIPLDGPQPAPDLPAGLSLRPMVRPDEDSAVYEVVETAFSDWPDRDTGTSFEDWRAAHLDRDDLEVLVLTQDDQIVGAAVCIEEEDSDEGWVEQLAVARTLRGRGLGQALLKESFRRFAARGRTSAGLSTDSRTGAKDLYEHVGMALTSAWTHWSKDLDT